MNDYMIVLLSTGVWGVVLGAASIAIAILIYFLQKQIRYPGQLKFAIIETWKVRSTSPNGYGELSLKYNDYVIKEELNYVKFILYNKKSFDYSSGDDDNPVRIVLPKGCNWIDAKIVESSEEIQAEIINKKGNELDLRFNLLRKNEYIEMDGIMESKSKISLRNLAHVIEVHHRIPNVSSVKNTTILDAYDYKHMKKCLVLFGIMMAFVVFTMVYALVINPTIPLKYKEIESGKTVSVYLDKRGNIVHHNGVLIWNRHSDPISKEDFENKYEPCFELSSINKNDYFAIGTDLFILLLFASLVIGYSIVLLKNNEIKKLNLRI